jgi:hypothetical protein
MLPFVTSSEVETSLTILPGSPARVLPAWVERCNQCHFLCSRPFLELLFTRYRIQHVCAVLVIDQFLTAVIRGETQESLRRDAR